MTGDLELFVVSGTWPGDSTGYELAVHASLAALRPHFAALSFVGPDDTPCPGPLPSVEWVPAPLWRGPQWLRFLASVRAGEPAIVQRFARAEAAILAAGRRAQQAARRRGRSLVVLYEDVPAARLLAPLRRAGVGARHVVRSHNALVKGFAGLERDGPLALRLAWRHELRRIERFEREVAARADRFWALSADDVAEYRARLGVAPDGVFGLSLSSERYADVARGDARTVVHLGSADLRKGRGLRAFVRDAWPRVRAQAPTARLVLGGRGTEAFDDPRAGIEGLGRVGDERALLGRGRVFVNPQMIGAGVKLKSVVALLAGRTLVSTPTGIEGVAGSAGRDFLSAPPAQLADAVLLLLHDESRALALAARGRRTAAESYCAGALARAVEPLVRELVRELERELRGAPGAAA